MIAISSLFLTTNMQGQTSKVKEYGIGFYGFNSYSLQYRWGNENRLYRLNGGIGSQTQFGNTQINSSKPTGNLGGGLSFGILKLKSINEKFGIFHGGSFGINYQYSVTRFTSPGMTSINKNQSLQPNIGITLGAFYKITPSIILYAEITPNIYYTYDFSKNSQTDVLSNQTEINKVHSNAIGLSSFSNSSALLTLAYRITK